MLGAARGFSHSFHWPWGELILDERLRHHRNLSEVCVCAFPQWTELFPAGLAARSSSGLCPAAPELRRQNWEKFCKFCAGCSCKSKAIALALGSRGDLLTEHLTFHAAWCDCGRFCPVLEAATVIFLKLFACCQCLQFQLCYRTKCSPALHSGELVSSHIILYSLQILTACAGSSCSLSQPLGFVLGDASAWRSCSV